ncbi:MAG: hypothetical protein AAF465_08245 [Pseudomonadota bacterium]
MISDVTIILFIACSAFLVVIAASFLLAKDVHLPEISGGAIPHQKNAKTVFWLALIFLCIIGPTFFLSIWLGVQYEAGFWTLLMAAYVMIVMLNAVDLLIFDIAIYMWWYPSWLRYEGYAPIHRYSYHFRAAIRGVTVVGVPLALMAAGTGWGIGRWAT